MAEITCEITEPIAVLSTNEKSGWTKEVNMVSWNKNSPKLDVRDWSPGHGRKGKGVALSEEETEILRNILNVRAEIKS